MSTNVRKLRDICRWNLFEFKDGEYVPVFPFAGSWYEMYYMSLSWPYCLGDINFVILPYGCSF